MSLIPPGQFRVAMPDGLVIERMPVGLGHGHWRLVFVVSGGDFSAGDPPRAVHFTDEFRARVRTEGLDAPLTCRGSRGGGGRDEQEVSMSYLADGPTAIRISYLHDDDVVATEVLRLDR